MKQLLFKQCCFAPHLRPILILSFQTFKTWVEQIVLYVSPSRPLSWTFHMASELALASDLSLILTLCPTFHRQWEASLHGHASEPVQPAAGWNQCPPPWAHSPETPAWGTCGQWEHYDPVIRHGHGGAAAAASLFQVAEEGHGHQSVFMWVVNRCGNIDMFGKDGPGDSARPLRNYSVRTCIFVFWVHWLTRKRSFCNLTDFRGSVLWKKWGSCYFPIFTSSHTLKWQLFFFLLFPSLYSSLSPFFPLLIFPKFNRVVTSSSWSLRPWWPPSSLIPCSCPLPCFSEVSDQQSAVSIQIP